MRRPQPLPEPLRDRPFSTQEAREHGVIRKRTRAADLTAPFHGVRAKGEASDTRSRAAAYATRMGTDQCFSHLTAAELLGLRLPSGFRPMGLHVTSIAPRRAPRGRNISGHQAATPLSFAVVESLRVTTPLQTWCDLGSSLKLDDLIVMGDGLLSRDDPLTTIDEVHAAIAATGSPRGVRKLRQAAAMMRARTDSAMETITRLVLTRAGLPEPEINGAIHNSYGVLIAHGDMVFRDWMTIIEYDGRQHWADAGQFSIDIARLNELAEEGWRVIRVDKSLLAQRATLVGLVRTALGRAGARLPPSN